MKTVIIIVICIFSNITYSIAQSSYQLAQTFEFFQTNKLQRGESNQGIAESDIEGSPYLNDEFIEGTVYTTSSLQYNNIPLRYNIFSNNLEFKTPENIIMTIATPEIIEIAEFGDYKMSYIPYAISKKIKRGFLTEIEKGKLSLYSKQEVQYQEPTKAAAYEDPEPARFVLQPDSYFIRVELNEAKIINNKKELIAIFPDHKKEVAAFIKKNKVKTNKEESLVKLLKYYNSL